MVDFDLLQEKIDKIYIQGNKYNYSNDEIVAKALRELGYKKVCFELWNLDEWTSGDIAESIFNFILKEKIKFNSSDCGEISFDNDEYDFIIVYEKKGK